MRAPVLRIHEDELIVDNFAGAGGAVEVDRKEAVRLWRARREAIAAAMEGEEEPA